MPPKAEPIVRGEWECMECGYIEKGSEARRPAQCPECGAPASALEFFADDDWIETGEADEEWNDENEWADEDRDAL